jgi:hypothetical protein
MQRLIPEDAETIAALILEELPQYVLWSVARQGNRRQIQISSEVRSRLPSSTPSDVVRSAVGTSLRWFVARGDVEKASGGRYLTLPPYVVVPQSDGPAWLYGDPRVESRLSTNLEPLGARIHSRTVKGGIGEDDWELNITVGLVRTLRIPQKQRSYVLENIRESRITVFSQDDLQRSLPSISAVRTPTREQLSDSPSGSAVWERYDPQIVGYDRWRIEPDWATSDASLVRRRVEASLGGSFFTQTYFQRNGRVLPLNSDNRALWQLALDAEARNPRTIRWNGRELVVPRLLPASVLQWLQVIADSPATIYGAEVRVEVSESLAWVAAAQLEESLGLRFVHAPEGLPLHG